jgi:hypothetical protein
MKTEIFVFGSNLAGRHGKGAALHAKNHYGAIQGVGFGRTGNAYAIPTKDENLQVLPLTTIRAWCWAFIEYARAHPELLFILTPVGTGYAGYTKEQIAPFLVGSIPMNVIYASTWFD